MPKFTFRLGLIDRLYAQIANFINNRILSKNTVDMDGIADIYDALDGFWFKHKDTSKYTTNQVRVIIGSVVESLRDNSLSAEEVGLITNNVISFWKPEVAESKPSEKVLISPKVEEAALKTVQVYDKLLPDNVAEFVSYSASMISKPLSVDRLAEALSGIFG